MSALPSVEDIATYLSGTDWHRLPHTWRGASIWTHDSGHQVLVPPRDGMGDGELRVREIIDVLASLEERTGGEIALEISSPLVDTQSYRVASDGLPSGFTTLAAGLLAMQGMHDILDAATRAVMQGPHSEFPRDRPRDVEQFASRIQLGPTRPGSYVLTVRVPVDESGPALGRQVALQVHDAVAAVREATSVARLREDLTAFDDTVTAGVSANLCRAVSALAGVGQRQPFAISFRWARGLPADRPPGSIEFEADSGRIIHAAADRLRRLRVSGEATMIGIVESLHDASGRDRWRVRVRGDLTTPHGTRRRSTVWVRLDGQPAYELAFTAHRAKLQIRATGVLTTTDRRVELVTPYQRFEVLD